MTNFIKPLFLLPALIAGLGLIPAGRVTAQTFTVLHNFDGSDGAYPHAGLVLSGNTLYGTASGGGSSGRGTVFAVNTDGTGFTTLHSFSAAACFDCANSDGTRPVSGLILSGNTLYGTASRGGSSGIGTVFAVNTDGAGFKTLHSFTNTGDGALPLAGLILSGNTLYGTTYIGGSSGNNGTVFAVNTNGTAFTTLYRFTAGIGSAPDVINSDGALPLGELILSGNTLYGTAAYGGSSARGTVFKVNTNGTGFTTLHSFSAAACFDCANSDGTRPASGLILSGNTLYGTASYGGSSGAGTVFAVNTDGTGFTTLHSFTGTSDGANLQAELILSGNTLYGTAPGGGSANNGTVFAVNTDGTGFTILYSFTAAPEYPSPPINSDGARPEAELILSGNTLYGTTIVGGSSGQGTVFSLSLPPPALPALKIIRSADVLVITWPESVAGAILETKDALTPASIWRPVETPPVVIGAQNVVTEDIVGPSRFYRLRKP